MSAARLAATVLLAVTLAGVTGGCAVGPRYHRPAAPANAGYAPAPLPETSASAPVHGGEVQRLVAGRDIPFEWWELFKSPALNALVERAFRANPTIAAAQAALVQAQELVYAQQGYFFPTVAANYNFERHKVAGNLTVDALPRRSGQRRQPAAPVQDPNQFPHTCPLYYDLYTAQLTRRDSCPTSSAPIIGRWKRWPRRRTRSASRWRPLTSRWPPMSSLPPSRKRRCVPKSRRPGRSSRQMKNRCRSCATSSGWASPCASTSRPRKQHWRRPRRRCRRLQKQFEQTRDLIRALVGQAAEPRGTRDLRARCAAAAG